MTEYDTPSTAHTEAARQYEDDYNDRAIFEAGAEWALAQVRVGLAALEWPGGDSVPMVWLTDALDVVDRLEGKQ